MIDMKSPTVRAASEPQSSCGSADSRLAVYPKITVVTPSFNQGRYLERTILSVIDQQYPNLEYIIMDGGSKDGSVATIKKYQSCIQYWESVQDEGQSHAVMKGFNMASGDVMAWLNSDDVYTPGALNAVAEFFLQNEDVDVVYGDSLIIDDKDNILRAVKSVPFSKWGFLTDAFSLHQASMFWRIDLYSQVRGLNVNLSLAMDRDLWFQFYLKDARFKHLKRTLSCYRRHGETKTSRYRQESLKIRNALRKDMLLIDAAQFKFKMIKSFMRLRTLMCHMLLGNISYLIRGAGRFRS